MAPQVSEKVTDGVTAPDASVREWQEWFLSVLQQFEESDEGGVWKQQRQEWEAEGWIPLAVWDQCLEWIGGQWGRWAWAVEFGRQELMDELRYGAGAGLVIL